jgi:hypothetical protein
MQAMRRRFPRRCHRTNGRFFKAAHAVQRRGVDRSKNSTCAIWRASADAYRPSRSNTSPSKLTRRWKQSERTRAGSSSGSPGPEVFRLRPRHPR